MSNAGIGHSTLSTDDAADSSTLPGVLLTVVEGPEAGLQVRAQSGVVSIGFSSGNDVPLSDPHVSRHHCELRLAPSEVRVVDLGSRNGTMLDGVRVLEAILSPASLLRVGTTVIRVTPVDEPVVVMLSARTRFGGLLGSSVAIREVFAVLESASRTQATILVEGETGTGKELVAEGVHAHSPWAGGPFIAIDCGAIAPSLIESELFGHARGSFTGAIADRKGAFEAANKGTLFLDEIGELPLDLQPKLLRALERREIRRVGESNARKVDVRVVAATNRNLREEVNRGTFRADLFYRLAVVSVRLPPLRARPEDIPLLARHFVDLLARGGGGLSEDTIAQLALRPWPGNVRELRNAVERALALRAHIQAPEGSAGVDPMPVAPAQLEAYLEMPFKDALDRITESFEKTYVTHVLAKSSGSVSGAARIAGMSRRYLQRVIQRHGMRATMDVGDDAGDD